MSTPSPRNILSAWTAFEVLLDGRSRQICQAWKPIGYNGFHKGYKPIHPSMVEVIMFKKDGTYDKVLNGQMII